MKSSNFKRNILQPLVALCYKNVHFNAVIIEKMWKCKCWLRLDFTIIVFFRQVCMRLEWCILNAVVIKYATTIYFFVECQNAAI